MICKQIKSYISGLPSSSHVELFKEVGSEWKLVLSASRLAQAVIKELARLLISEMKSKPYLHYILLKTLN